jgi:hypothetical protein
MLRGCALAWVVSYAQTAHICSVVPERAVAALVCPAGTVIASIDAAAFGTFAAPPPSCDAPAFPPLLPACPNTVVAQLDLLCRGRAACAPQCDCAYAPCRCSTALAAGALRWQGASTPGGAQTLLSSDASLGRAGCLALCRDAVRRSASGDDTGASCGHQCNGCWLGSGPPSAVSPQSNSSCFQFSAPLGTVAAGFPGAVTRQCDGTPKTLAVRASCAAANATLPSPPPPRPQAAPSQSRINGLPCPALGIDARRPTFAWRAPQPSDGAARLDPALHGQVAAQVQVHRGAPGGASTLVWDSGRVNGSAPHLAPATELPLASDAAYTWTVRTWSATGAAPSDWSGAASFTTGLLEPSDWGADVSALWLGGGNLLRAEFEVPAWADTDDINTNTNTNTTAATAGGGGGGGSGGGGGGGGGNPVGRVSVFVSGCQYYELYLDGGRVGDAELDVAWTYFSRNRSYAALSIDPARLAPGRHALGLMLGEGFCGQAGEGKAGNTTRAGLLRLALHDAADDRVRLVVGTGDGGATRWRAAQGAILYDSTYVRSPLATY